MDVYTLGSLAHQQRFDLGKKGFDGNGSHYAIVTQALLTSKGIDIKAFDSVRKAVTEHAEETFLKIGEDVESRHYIIKVDSVRNGIQGYINLVNYAAQKKQSRPNDKVEDRVLGEAFNGASPRTLKHHSWASQCGELAKSSANIADRLFNIANTPESRYTVIMAALTSLNGLVHAASQSGHAIDVTPYKEAVIGICKGHGIHTSKEEDRRDVYRFWAGNGPAAITLG